MNFSRFPSHLPSRNRAIVSASILLLLGIIAWPFLFDGSNSAALKAFVSFGMLGPGGLLIFILIVIAIAAVPPVAGPIDRFLLRLRDATNARRKTCAVAAAFFSVAYFCLTAHAQHRQFFPIYHDEFSYLIQAHQLAVGHFWMPPHPLAKFFDSFQLLVEPVYASAYFPGTAMLYVPGVWLHLPPYFTSLTIAGSVSGILFWITTELLDGLAGWLAVMLLLSDGLFRQLSIMSLAQLPLLLYALLAITVWLRFQATGKFRWAFGTGCFLGLAAITRPADALCFALPIGVATLFSKSKSVTRAPGRCLATMIMGASPFLCLQLFLNHNITGHWLQTPFTMYANRDYPGTAYGFHPFDPGAHPQSPLPQKQMLYASYFKMIQDHLPANILRDLFPFRLRAALSQNSPAPFPVLILFCPLALLRLTKSRAVLLATLPLFLLLYAAYAFFLPHYVMVTAPAVILGILAGAGFGSAQADAGSEVRRRDGSAPAKPGTSENLKDWRYKTVRRFATVALTLFIAGEALAALPQSTGSTDDAINAPLLKSVNDQLATLPHHPAVVLFKFDPNRNLAEEPVYNADVAWPDDAEVIRAHDLGAANRELFAYYADYQPERAFYRFDEATKTLLPLGANEILH